MQIPKPITPRRWRGNGTRRQLLGNAMAGAGALGLAAGMSAIRPASAFAAGGRTLGDLAAVMQSGYAWVGNHGLSGDDYQSEFDSLSGQGYRLRNICGYNVSGQDLYASIWDQSPGPAWVGMHRVVGSDYQTQFDH